MVTPNTSVMNTETAEEAAWGIVKGRSTKSLKFADKDPQVPGQYNDRPVGTTYTGTLVENIVAQQATDFDTGEPKFYANSTDPIYELVMVLDVPTDIDPADADDDGKRVLRLSAGGKRALQDECRAKGIERFGVGTIVTITFTGYKPNPKGRASKTFAIELSNIQPYRSTEQMKVEQAMQQGAPAAPQAAPAVPQAAPAVPPTPVAVPQAPAAVPQAAPAVDPALLAAAQAAQQAAAPAPTAPAGIVITLEHVEKVRGLLGMNIPREVALQAVTNTEGGGDAAFQAALDAAEQNAPF